MVSIVDGHRVLWLWYTVISVILFVTADIVSPGTEMTEDRTPLLGSASGDAPPPYAPPAQSAPGHKGPGGQYQG